MANLENFKLLRKKTANRKPGKINLDRIWTGDRNPISCDTPACIMGLALALAYPKAQCMSDLYCVRPVGIFNTSDLAREWLGINQKEYDELTDVLEQRDHMHLFSVSRDRSGNQRREALDRLDICIAYLEAKQNG